MSSRASAHDSPGLPETPKSSSITSCQFDSPPNETTATRLFPNFHSHETFPSSLNSPTGQLQFQISTSGSLDNEFPLTKEIKHSSWVSYHKGKQVAPKDEVYLIPCDAQTCGGDAKCIGKTIRERHPGFSEVTVSENNEDYEVDCSDSDCLIGRRQRSPVAPRASIKSPEIFSQSNTIDGLPLPPSQNATLLFTTPRLLISPVSEFPARSLSCGGPPQVDDHCSDSSQSLTPLSALFSQSPNFSRVTMPSETELDVLLGSNTPELLTEESATREVRLGRSFIVPASSSVVVKRSCARDFRYITSEWSNLTPRRSVIRTRSMEVFGTVKGDEIPFHFESAASPGLQPSYRLVLDVDVSSNHDGKEDSMTKRPEQRPEPINVQMANAPFRVRSQLTPEPGYQVSLASPWRCSYSRVSNSSQIRDVSHKLETTDLTEGKTTTLCLSGTCTDAIRTEVDSLPPTPNSSASVWSQDSAPNSAIFWDINAREYASELDLTRMLNNSSPFRLVTIHNHYTWDKDDGSPVLKYGGDE